MERKPIQFTVDNHRKLVSDARRYNKKKIEDVVMFHRERSYKYERIKSENIKAVAQ